MVSGPHDSGDDGDRRDYLKELPTLLRLKQQRVQRDWPQPGPDLGRVSAICLGDVTSEPVDEIIIGTEEGHILAVNIARARIAWETSLGKAIKAIQTGTKDLDSYDTTLVCTGDEQIYALDEHGTIVTEQGRTFPGEHIVCLAVSRRGKRPLGTLQEILVGSQEGHVYVYDANLQNRSTAFSVPDVVNVLSCYDLTARDSAEIIAGTLDGHVYAYQRRGGAAEELWRNKIGACVRALVVKDLDEDGSVEVIVGSDDGNVHVLNAQGQLKWRYSIVSPVLAVNVLDIDHDGKNEILLGGLDGTLYVLNAEGDLCWTFQTDKPIRDIYAGDINNDGIIEIALRVGEQLDLLQVVDQQGLQKKLQQCIEQMSSGGNAQAVLLELTNSTDEAMRIFALEALVDYCHPSADYFERLQGALNDPSLEVRKQAVNAILSLGKIISKDDIESRHQQERLLQVVAASPEQAVRLSLSNLLHKLVKLSVPLCFEYIKRFRS